MKKTDHITPALKKLQRLPVKNRIIFKLLLITHKSLNGLAPVYIKELLSYYTPCRSLSSIDSNLLVIPTAVTVTYGDRSFAVIAPKLWNQLLVAFRQSNRVDSFKRALKHRDIYKKNAFLRTLLLLLLSLLLLLLLSL